MDILGITDELLEDPDSAIFIHEYVMRHGGIEEVTRLLEAMADDAPTNSSDDDVDGDDICATYEPSEEIISLYNKNLLYMCI